MSLLEAISPTARKLLHEHDDADKLRMDETSGIANLRAAEKVRVVEALLVIAAVLGAMLLIYLVV